MGGGWNRRQWGVAREREAVSTDTSERMKTTRRSKGLTLFIGFAGWFSFTGLKNATTKN
jgi:hypothetical protein